MRKRILALVLLVPAIVCAFVVPVCAWTAGPDPNTDEQLRRELVPVFDYSLTFSLNTGVGGNFLASTAPPALATASGESPANITPHTTFPLAYGAYGQVRNISDVYDPVPDYRILDYNGKPLAPYLFNTPYYYPEDIGATCSHVALNVAPFEFVRTEGELVSTLGQITTKGEDTLATVKYRITTLVDGIPTDFAGTTTLLAYPTQTGDNVFPLGSFFEHVLPDSTAPVKVNYLEIVVESPEYVRVGTIYLASTSSVIVDRRNLVPSQRISNVTQVRYEPLNLSGFATTIMDAVNGFLAFELFPGVTLATIFYVIVGLLALVVILKIFAGG